MAQKPTTVGDVANSDTPENRAALQKELDALTTDGTLSRGHSFDSANAAAKSVLEITAPLSAEYGLEVGGNIYQGKGSSYHYTLPQIGSAGSVGIRSGWAGYHTHPSGGLRFSNRISRADPRAIDSVWVNSNNRALYLGVQRFNGSLGIAVCEPGSCSNIQRGGTVGRVIQ
ncbi:MAG: hypothetical protein JKY66_05180 [Spongiibacteraceae bacterium]|nr:hypothetical protein [Spongiibacteraceae bacterium]